MLFLEYCDRTRKHREYKRYLIALSVPVVGPEDCSVVTDRSTIEPKSSRRTCQSASTLFCRLWLRRAYLVYGCMVMLLLVSTSFLLFIVQNYEDYERYWDILLPKSVLVECHAFCR